ncbi:hypothetical protein D3C74_380300 [compost metagenome]
MRVDRAPPVGQRRGVAGRREPRQEGVHGVAPHVDGLVAVDHAQDAVPFDDVRREVGRGRHEVLVAPSGRPQPTGAAAHRDLVPDAHLGTRARVHLVHAPRAQRDVVDGERRLQEVPGPGTGEQLRGGVHESKARGPT